MWSLIMDNISIGTSRRPQGRDPRQRGVGRLLTEAEEDGQGRTGRRVVARRAAREGRGR